MTGLTFDPRESLTTNNASTRETTTTRTTHQATTHRERAILALLVATVTFGLAIDTRSHRMSAAIDTFFTREHALGYAGATACGLFMLYLIRSRQISGLTGRKSIPLGLESAVAGLGVYVVGGIGDLSWHTAFGVEQELKILFSPTHLLLMSAMLMLAFGPIRSAWMTRDLDSEGVSSNSPEALGIRAFCPIALAGGSMATVLNIFFTYASPYEASVFTVEIPLLFQQFGTFLQVAATLGVFVHTLIFFGIIMLMLRRWPLPAGTILLMLTIPALSMYVYFDYEFRREMVALLIGAVTCEALLFAIQRIRSVRLRFRLFGGIAPVLFWITYLALTKGSDPISWTTEQWTGTIAWTGLLGLAITVLLLPPQLERMSYLD